jgi:signal transduction histidine kinase
VRDGIAFSVRDYGPGIPRDQLAKIFKLFYRVENELTRETVGTGIGLALVKQLTEAMGGRVDARNAEPGAEFTVTLAAA